MVPDEFYHRRIMAATAVLHVGCGDGTLLHHARAAGHRGPLAGVDPDPAHLARAGQREDIEWVLGTAAAMPFEQEFDLAVMTGRAFRHLRTLPEIRAGIAGVRAALHEGGRFAFEAAVEPEVLNRLLREAGFVVEEQHGDPAVTIARRY